MTIFSQDKLAQYTTFRIGGPARALFISRSAEDVIEAINKAKSTSLAWRVIGHGSNILAADKSLGSAIIVFKDSSSPQIQENGDIVVSGGYPLSGLAIYLASKGLGGLENLAGIPGTVGGAIVGNAGAYGSAIGDAVKNVSLINKAGKILEAGADMLKFSYRHSRLKETGETVLKATIRTTQCESEKLHKIIETRLADRLQKHPDYREFPTAGSFFKNPMGTDGRPTSAGQLLQEAGCKTLRVGGAYVWPKHANIIVSDGKATAEDVLRLSAEMKARVKKLFGIELEQEVCFLE